MATPADPNSVATTAKTMVKMGDGTSIGILLATWAEVLPHVAAALTIVWTLIRIWETDTVKELRAQLFRR